MAADRYLWFRFGEAWEPYAGLAAYVRHVDFDAFNGKPDFAGQSCDQSRFVDVAAHGIDHGGAAKCADHAEVAYVARVEDSLNSRLAEYVEDAGVQRSVCV